MAQSESKRQEESRSETLTMRLTPTERTAIRVVAGLRETEDSNLLREMTLTEVLEEFRRIKSAA